jgi:uncharacterized membrane protein YeiH
MPDTDFYYALELLGVAVGSIQGALYARAVAKMSLVGVAVLAFVTALGGGAIRDSLIGVRSAVLSNPLLLTWLVSTILAMAVAHLSHRLLPVLNILSAAYLGIWTVVGADRADHFGLGVVAVVLLGVVTAVGGGVIRDLLAGQVPVVLQAGPLYSIAALLGAVVLVALHHSPLPRPVDGVTAAVLIFVLRLLAVHKRWLLPEARALPTAAGLVRRRRPPVPGRTHEGDQQVDLDQQSHHR